VIWLASDSVAGRTVVVSSVTSARVAGLKKSVGLNHPHLATLLDLFDDISPGQIPGHVALRPGMAIAVAEHVAGQTLHERLESGALSPHRAVSVVASIANALYLLHSEGGVHGALSPRSVVVTRNDGGMVPVLTNLRAAANGAYCSPERVRGGGPSPEDDTWALYATLFAALTGETPYEGKTREELAASILSGAVPSLLVHGVSDPALQQFMRQGLQLDRAARQVSVAGLEKSLVTWLRAHPSGDQERVSTVAPLFSLPPPPIDDEDVAEGHRTLAVTSPISDGRLPEDEFDDDDDDMATVQLDAGSSMATALAMYGSPLGGDAEDPSLKDQLATSVMSGPMLDDMVDQLRDESARAREPMPSVTQSMDPALVEAFRVQSALGDSVEVELTEPAIDVWPEDPPRPDLGPPPFGSPPVAPPPAQPPTSGPQRGWGPADPTPPHIDPSILSAVAQDEAARQADPASQGFIDPSVGVADPALANPVESQLIPDPPKKKRSVFWLVLGGMLLMVFAAALSFTIAVVTAGGRLPAPVASILERVTGAPAPVPSASSPLPAASETPGATAAPVDSVAPADSAAPVDSAAPADSAAPPGTASTQLPAEEDLRACVEDFFPQGTFVRKVPFDYVCANDNPRKAAVMLHQQLVKGGAGGVTEGMRMWSSLSWYELVVVSMIRDACCPGASPLDLPEPGEPCAPMVGVIAKVSRGGCTQEAARERALLFEESVRCLYAHERPRPYRYQGVVRPHQRMAFEEFLQRLPPARCTP
jgi:hypothetical protein